MCSSYTEALIHIFDNDTSGLVRSDRMTVRYRCGQCNELPTVRIFFISSDKSIAVYQMCFYWQICHNHSKRKGTHFEKVGGKMQAKVNTKNFIRYDEGAERYSMSKHSFMKLAQDARAVYKINRITLVNVKIFEEYLESFRA